MPGRDAHPGRARPRRSSTETGTWTLQTLNDTEPCGYVMVATASDNTIVDSGFVGFETQAFQGFCLRPAVKG